MSGKIPLLTLMEDLQGTSGQLFKGSLYRQSGAGSAIYPFVSIGLIT